MGSVSYLGFNRSQALAVMQIHRIKPKRQRAMLDALTEMETAALPILNQR